MADPNSGSGPKKGEGFAPKGAAVLGPVMLIPGTISLGKDAYKIATSDDKTKTAEHLLEKHGISDGQTIGWAVVTAGHWAPKVAKLKWVGASKSTLTKLESFGKKADKLALPLLWVGAAHDGYNIYKYDDNTAKYAAFYNLTMTSAFAYSPTVKFGSWALGRTATTGAEAVAEKGLAASAEEFTGPAGWALMVGDAAVGWADQIANPNDYKDLNWWERPFQTGSGAIIAQYEKEKDAKEELLKKDDKPSSLFHPEWAAHPSVLEYFRLTNAVTSAFNTYAANHPDDKDMANLARDVTSRTLHISSDRLVAGVNKLIQDKQQEIDSLDNQKSWLSSLAFFMHTANDDININILYKQSEISAFNGMIQEIENQGVQATALPEREWPTYTGYRQRENRWNTSVSNYETYIALQKVTLPKDKDGKTYADRNPDNFIQDLDQINICRLLQAGSPGQDMFKAPLCYDVNCEKPEIDPQTKQPITIGDKLQEISNSRNLAQIAEMLAYGRKPLIEADIKNTNDALAYLKAGKIDDAVRAFNELSGTLGDIVDKTGDKLADNKLSTDDKQKALTDILQKLEDYKNNIEGARSAQQILESNNILGKTVGLDAQASDLMLVTTPLQLENILQKAHTSDGGYNMTKDFGVPSPTVQDALELALQDKRLQLMHDDKLGDVLVLRKDNFLKLPGDTVDYNAIYQWMDRSNKKLPAQDTPEFQKAVSKTQAFYESDGVKDLLENHPELKPFLDKNQGMIFDDSAPKDPGKLSELLENLKTIQERQAQHPSLKLEGMDEVFKHYELIPKDATNTPYVIPLDAAKPFLTDTQKNWVQQQKDGKVPKLDVKTPEEQAADNDAFNKESDAVILVSDLHRNENTQNVTAQINTIDETTKKLQEKLAQDQRTQSTLQAEFDKVVEDARAQDTDRDCFYGPPEPEELTKINDSLRETQGNIERLALQKDTLQKNLQKDHSVHSEMDVQLARLQKAVGATDKDCVNQDVMGVCQTKLTAIDTENGTMFATTKNTTLPPETFIAGAPELLKSQQNYLQDQAQVESNHRIFEARFGGLEDQRKLLAAKDIDFLLELQAAKLEEVKLAADYAEMKAAQHTYLTNYTVALQMKQQKGGHEENVIQEIKVKAASNKPVGIGPQADKAEALASLDKRKIYESFANSVNGAAHNQPDNTLASTLQTPSMQTSANISIETSKSKYGIV